MPYWVTHLLYIQYFHTSLYPSESSTCIVVFGITHFPLALKGFTSRRFLNVLVLVVAMDTSSFTYFHVSCFTPAYSINFCASFQPQKLKPWIISVTQRYIIALNRESGNLWKLLDKRKCIHVFVAQEAILTKGLTPEQHPYFARSAEQYS